MKTTKIAMLIGSTIGFVALLLTFYYGFEKSRAARERIRAAQLSTEVDSDYDPNLPVACWNMGPVPIPERSPPPTPVLQGLSEIQLDDVDHEAASSARAIGLSKSPSVALKNVHRTVTVPPRPSEVNLELAPLPVAPFPMPSSAPR